LPGSGKSTDAKHAAESLKREFGYISLNPQTPESRLLGFIDANGKYRATVFFKLYTEGGVFCIDEMDNASAALLTTLNSLLENGLGAFPHGVFERHKNFIVVSTGNTTGRGGNPQFPERRAFDAAFAERFVYVYWDYDERMEREVAIAINGNAAAWVDWVQKVRAFARTNDPKLVVSPRASFKIAKYLSVESLTREEVVEAALFKGIEEQRKTRILNALPLPVAA
jgi:midasin (ATPase involved in ribosome maturation)